MKRKHLTAAIAAAIAVPALGLGLNGAASAGTVPAGPASAVSAGPASVVSAGHSVRTVVLDCLGHPRVRPGAYTIACGDGNDYLNGLSWTSWAPRLAAATGVEHVNDCVPYCAAGHFHSYPVDVVLWGSAAAGPGHQRYTKITMLYPGAHPPYVGRHQPATFSEPLYP
jgi:hypothetical protein